MTRDQLSHEMHRTPFQPFQLVLVDGVTFVVDHPDFVSIDRLGRQLTFHALDNTRHEIDTRLISRIVAVDVGSSVGSNTEKSNGGE